MSAWRYLATTAAAGLLYGALAAAATEIRPSAPDSYTVRDGDTLWDIAGRFLYEPWYWPEIWQRNPYIDDPDLIYPGDVLYLGDADGRPVVRLARASERFASGRPAPGGRRVVKLQPQVRVEARPVAIPTIPIDAIRQFLSRPMVVEENELESAPYIVSLGTEHLIGGPGQRVYVRGKDEMQPGILYTVLRRGDAYVDPDDPDGAVLGYAADYIADAILERTGDPSTLVLVNTQREVLVGDRLLPSSDEAIQGAFLPHPPVDAVRGKIIAVVEGVTHIGVRQVVVLNVGRDAGLDQGAVLAVYQRGAEIRDPYAVNPDPRLPEPDAQIELDPERQRGLDGLTIAMDRMVRDLHDLVTPEDTSYRNVRLPEERAGTLMVFRAFDRLSYALVMDASRAIHVADIVTNP